MDETLRTFADVSIRRACAFTGLAVMTVMLALSYDLTLSFRIGAQMIAFLVFGLVLAGWRAPHRNLRHSEVYAMLRSAGVPRGRLARAEMQARLGAILRDRLFWHAERVALLALGLWALALLSWLVH
ncbi:hypothetical protein [Rubritepida flocculans]|uniref:hypothetical protein n=1 Tax=Rubritepida flocculans TaxID=182403 RepID=UPI0012EBBD9C|nr:hypothetical protein [Rubritepida flocculans]